MFLFPELRTSLGIEELQGDDLDFEEYFTWLFREERGRLWQNDNLGQRLYNYHRLLITFAQQNGIAELVQDEN